MRRGQAWSCPCAAVGERGRDGVAAVAADTPSTLTSSRPPRATSRETSEVSDRQGAGEHGATISHVATPASQAEEPRRPRRGPAARRSLVGGLRDDWAAPAIGGPSAGTPPPAAVAAAGLSAYSPPGTAPAAGPIAGSCPSRPGTRRRPSIWTSGSSTTPNRSWTRRRPSAISARTSAVVASPAFSTKLACLAREARAADAQPAAARRLEQLPGGAALGRGSSGFLKVEPKVLIPDGCASRRLARISASVALISSGRRGRSANEARATTSPGAQVRAAVGEAELVRGAPLGSRRRVQTSTHSSDPRQLAAVGVGVHPHRAADGAGDVDPELEPGQAPARGLRGRPRAGGRRRRRRTRSPSRSIGRSSPSSFKHQPADAVVGDQEVRARADDPYREALVVRPARGARAAPHRSRAGRTGRRAAGADGRQPRERIVALDRLRGSRSSGRPTRHSPRAGRARR